MFQDADIEARNPATSRWAIGDYVDAHLPVPDPDVLEHRAYEFIIDVD